MGYPLPPSLISVGNLELPLDSDATVKAKKEIIENSLLLARGGEVLLDDLGGVVSRNGTSLEIDLNNQRIITVSRFEGVSFEKLCQLLNLIQTS